MQIFFYNFLVVITKLLNECIVISQMPNEIVIPTSYRAQTDAKCRQINEYFKTNANNETSKSVQNQKQRSTFVYPNSKHIKRAN